MFSKAKKKDNKAEDLTSELVEIGDAPEKARPAPAKTAKQQNSRMMSGNQKRVSRSSGVPSLISGDVIIKGTIEAEGEVQFDGAIEGDIKAKGLVIGDGASVKGEIVAQKVKVSGTVEGAIRAGQVELASTAHVKGDILHSALSIETGARFDGNCRHSDDPTSETPTRRPMRAAAKPVTTSADAAEEAPVEAEEAVAEVAEAPALKTVESASGSSFLSRGGKSDLR
jgi:cytoskeletal protein CcmA (bactofilin family)